MGFWSKYSSTKYSMSWGGNESASVWICLHFVCINFTQRVWGNQISPSERTWVCWASGPGPPSSETSRSPGTGGASAHRLQQLYHKTLSTFFFFKYQMIIMSAHHSQPNLPMSLEHSTTQQVKTLNISTHRYVLFSRIHMIHTRPSLTLTSSVWTRRECPLRWLSGTRTHPPSAPPWGHEQIE